MTQKEIPKKGDSSVLSAEEKKRLTEQMKRKKRLKPSPFGAWKSQTDTHRMSAQQSIPYVEMCRDGICRVNARLYTKTIRYEDINYQLAQNEDKTAIFEDWCDFLNYFDSSIFIQLSFINQKTDIAEFRKAITIPHQDDDFNDIRSEYSDMLDEQLTKGNNGLVKRKYITFGVQADSMRTAKPKLERIELDIRSNFKTLGVKSFTLSGYERLKVLHGIFNMDSPEPFRFSFDMVARTGLSTKDFIAPTSFDFREGKCFKMGKTVGAVSFLQILAPELSDRMLAEFLEMDQNITVNLHIHTVDQAQAIKRVKSKITDLDKMKIEEQKKAVRSGYDMDIIPSDLATFGGEAKKLLQDLQTRNERMFMVTVLLMNTASNRQKLENAIFQTASIAQKYNCSLKRLDFQQEAGLMSSDLLYDKSANKQFITVQTRGGNTFYIIIDYDKPLDGDGEQYATYFLNPVDERDLFDLLGDEEIPPETCKCTDKCEVGAINISCSVCKSDYEKCIGIEHKAVAPAVEEGKNLTDNETLKDEPSEQKSSGSTVLIIALVAGAAIAGGVYYYIKVVKGKRSKDSDTEFFDDDGYEDEYINEDNDNEDDVEADESEI